LPDSVNEIIKIKKVMMEKEITMAKFPSFGGAKGGSPLLWKGWRRL
jgi:hypothetical protein